MKIISWSMQHKHSSWRRLLEMDIDLAPLQEGSKRPSDVAKRLQAEPSSAVDSAPWQAAPPGAMSGSHSM